jgi:hypothetical protein
LHTHLASQSGGIDESHVETAGGGGGAEKGGLVSTEAAASATTAITSIMIKQNLETARTELANL